MRRSSTFFFNKSVCSIIDINKSYWIISSARYRYRPDPFKICKKRNCRLRFVLKYKYMWSKQKRLKTTKYLKCLKM